MPCYVITHTRFRDDQGFREFRTRLDTLADRQHFRLHPLSDVSTLPRPDQAVMMEFENAESAHAFMGSDLFRAISREPALSA
ncbi:hypothetical protein ATO6_17180 [Oceanicola sp. 22II-s10i]|uniref:DUF1330 domain-containing protein n=1 Tax=Oceanicola sp. 22II-s10i TaxID=1317116 RepID=UPI000B527ADF|nr:DUF1330 domain-containing protein [Oceanicola sp. 22II-s10i]OWU83603.1 hypothetical protein ATO6_17180 [Oceanicola sp. 22II-s10i]